MGEADGTTFAFATSTPPQGLLAWPASDASYIATSPRRLWSLKIKYRHFALSNTLKTGWRRRDQIKHDKNDAAHASLTLLALRDEAYIIASAAILREAWCRCGLKDGRIVTDRPPRPIALDIWPKQMACHRKRIATTVIMSWSRRYLEAMCRAGNVMPLHKTRPAVAPDRPNIVISMVAYRLW